MSGLMLRPQRLGGPAGARRTADLSRVLFSLALPPQNGQIVSPACRSAIAAAICNGVAFRPLRACVSCRWSAYAVQVVRVNGLRLDVTSASVVLDVCACVLTEASAPLVAQAVASRDLPVIIVKASSTWTDRQTNTPD